MNNTQKTITENLKFRNIHNIPLTTAVKESLQCFFEKIDDPTTITNLYDKLINEIEKPLLKAVIYISAGNQTKVAKILGLGKVTVRNKMKKHGFII